MGKINVTQVIKNFDDEPMTLNNEEMTLRSALTTALAKSQEQQAAAKQYELFSLGLRISRRDELELTSEERTTLKEACSKVFTPIVTGRVWQILEGLTDEDILG
jgi:hypothetical protein